LSHDFQNISYSPCYKNNIITQRVKNNVPGTRNIILYRRRKKACSIALKIKLLLLDFDAFGVVIKTNMLQINIYNEVTESKGIKPLMGLKTTKREGVILRHPLFNN
jgi:hypothetical protein